MILSNLSCEERAYLLGLYFADGCKVSSGIQFTLAIYEWEIVHRIVEFFERQGLRPRVYSYPDRTKCIKVYINNVHVRSCFPDKREFFSLVLDDSHVQRWVNRESLEGNLGVPFIAGLLDGDGLISAKVEYGRTIFGSLHSYWTFFQVSYPFLVDFIRRYINHLVPGGAHFNRAKEGEVVKISGQGREALIANGIAIWSVKVSKWIGEVEELRRQISDLKAEFLSPAEVAVRLQQAISRWTIREWCDRGYVRHIRIRATTTGPFRYLIPVAEAQTLDAEIRRSRSYSESMLSKSECLSEKLVAHALGIKLDTVYHYCHRGKLKGIPLFTLGGRRTALIPRWQVENWLKKSKRVRKTS
jgi:hypothetical protein